MLSKSPTKLEKRDIDDLIGNTHEGKTLEFKRIMPASSDKEKGAFLRAVSSFANTIGGDLIIGLSAANGIASGITEIALSEFDGYRLKLEQTLASGLDPRIPGIEFGRVDCSDTGCVLVIRVPRSWSAPHRVTLNSKFYGRTSGGSYELDVRELRSLFVLSEAIAEKTRSFRIDRIAKIAARDTPVELMSGGILVLHLVPFTAFDRDLAFPIRDIKPIIADFAPIGSSGGHHAYKNFEGFLTASNSAGPMVSQRAYVQVFRSGIVEAVASSIVRGAANLLPMQDIEQHIIAHTRIYAANLHKFGIAPPIAVLASLVDVKGKILSPYKSGTSYSEDMASLAIRQDQLHFLESIFETLPADVAECATMLRGTLDHIANASGLPASPNFDSTGVYKFRTE